MISLIKKSYPKLKTVIQRRCCGVTLQENDNGTIPSKKTAHCDGKPTKWPSGNRIQYKFHPETENALNQQINVEFAAFYVYLSMAAYFGRVDVALPGCESFFIQMHEEEREHALQFLNYVNMRGGIVKLYPIHTPVDQDWKCPLHAFKAALELEISISNKLETASSIAEKHGDISTSEFIQGKFMINQMKGLNELAKLTTVLSGVGDEGHSRFTFDNNLKPGKLHR